MKKYLILLTLLLSLLIMKNDVKADNNHWWIDDNIFLQSNTTTDFIHLYSDYWAYQIKIKDINLQANTSGVYLFIPDYYNFTLVNGNIPIELNMTDKNNDNIDSIYYNSNIFHYKVKGDHSKVAGLYYFPTRNIGNNTNGFNFIVDRIGITIPILDTAHPGGSTATGIYQNTISHRTIIGKYDYKLNWRTEVIANNYNYIITDVVFDKEWNVTSFFIPQSQYHIGGYNSAKTRVEYYNSDNVVICIMDLSEENSYNKIFNINPSISNSCKEFTSVINKAKIFIVQSPYNISVNQNDYINYINEKSKIAFNIELYLANVYNGNQLLIQNAYSHNEFTGSILPHFILDEEPKSYNENLIFSNWAYISGNEYRMFEEKVNNKVYYYAPYEPNPDYYLNNTINLYATFKIKSDTITQPIKNVDNNVGIVLGAFGFDNPIGYLILYSIIILIVDILLFIALHNNLLILVINLIITALFTFLGVFSLLILILLYSLQGVLFLIELKRE